MTFVAIAFALLGTAILFAGGVAILGFGAWSWCLAISAAHAARSHGITVDAQAETTDDAIAALAEAERFKQRRDPWSSAANEDEMRAAILAERESEATSTTENEDLDEEPLVPRDEMYVYPAGEEEEV